MFTDAQFSQILQILDGLHTEMIGTSGDIEGTHTSTKSLIAQLDKKLTKVDCQRITRRCTIAALALL